MMEKPARTGSVASSDRVLLYGAAFLRATTTSLFGVLAGLHLGRLGLSPRSVGMVIGAGLGGAAFAAALATFFADRVGRRRFLLLVAFMSGAGVLAFAFASRVSVLAAAAFVGMLNGMGRDRGAALIIEQAALPATTSDQDRTRAMAIYTMLQDIGHALGALLAGLPAAWGATRSTAASQRPLLLICAAVAVVVLVLYMRLGPSIEGVDRDAERRTGPMVSPSSRRILTRICALFALDGIGGGFLTTAMLSYFFFERFGVNEAWIGALFFGARLMNAASHLGAAWLARRIGLVNTMVFTHIPSSLLLITVAVAPNFPVAAVLFLLREGLVEMDVPTRQSYVLAVVAPRERTFASGITNLVRLGAWAIAPTVAGALTIGTSMVVPLTAAAAMKITYDVLLYLAFRKVRPPEEQREA